MKFVPGGPINNFPALVQIMAWRRPGDKPLSEPMVVRLPTHICVTRPLWVKFTEPRLLTTKRIFSLVSTLRAEQSGCHFADEIFNTILGRKWWHCDSNFIELRANEQYVPIGSYDVLAPSRRQAITWTSQCRPNSRMHTYVPPGINELRRLVTYAAVDCIIQWSLRWHHNEREGV